MSIDHECMVNALFKAETSLNDEIQTTWNAKAFDSLKRYKNNINKNQKKY
jgi:hypothetical protein